MLKIKDDEFYAVKIALEHCIEKCVSDPAFEQWKSVLAKIAKSTLDSKIHSLMDKIDALYARGFNSRIQRENLIDKAIKTFLENIKRAEE